MTRHWPSPGQNNIDVARLANRSASRGLASVQVGLRLSAVLIATVALGFFSSAASAERWMCPDCDAMVERALGTSLECAACEGTYTEDDLSWYVSFVNYRTRDVEISFLILPEDCEIFRPDGLQALDGEGPYWVPWSKVDYFIPRMRLIRLVDGREVNTDYPKGPTCQKPPEFLFEITDPVHMYKQPPRTVNKSIETDMAALFVVAGTEESLDRGVLRFIKEVEAGLHPRLPRTKARATRVQPVRVPRGVPLDELEDKKVVVRVRIADFRQIQHVSILQSSGFPTLDSAAATQVLGSGLMSGGEMGVPVPATVEFHYTFAGGTPAAEFVVPDNSIWGDRGPEKETEGE